MSPYPLQVRRLAFGTLLTWTDLVIHSPIHLLFVEVSGQTKVGACVTSADLIYVPSLPRGVLLKIKEELCGILLHYPELPGGKGEIKIRWVNI